MTVHLLKALKEIRERLINLAAETEEQVSSSVRALIDHDAELAEQVITFDDRIDELEVELEEECLKTLSLYQPMAQDLRLIVTALKINNDLERIGDLAANIAARAVDLSQAPPLPEPLQSNIERMTEIAKLMLRNCIQAFTDRSPDLAHSVFEADREMNRLHSGNFRMVETAVREQPEQAQAYISLLSVSRYLERIGDQTKNIAEDVIYLTEARIIRHTIPTD